MTPDQKALQLKITELAADIELEAKFGEHNWATQQVLMQWLTRIDEIGDAYADEVREQDDERSKTMRGYRRRSGRAGVRWERW